GRAADLSRPSTERSRSAGYQCEETAMWYSTVRDFITLALVLLAVPLTSDAQQPRPIPWIVYLTLSPTPLADRHQCFVHGLRALGYVEDHHILLEHWGSGGNVDRLRENAAEVVRRGVQVMVTQGSLATRVATEMTRTIPIVMSGDSDPVGDGFVASLGQP